jgi:hypothetical protein
MHAYIHTYIRERNDNSNQRRLRLSHRALQFQVDADERWVWNIGGMTTRIGNRNTL